MAKNKTRARAATPKSCPCGSARDYSACCAPLHAGERGAESAFEQVRARYSAFALGLSDYLWRTLHPDHDACEAGEAAYRQGVERMQRGHDYRGTRLLDQTPEDPQGASQLLYLAQIKQHKRDMSFVELADFVHDAHGYRYLGGTTRGIAELGHAPEEMSIDHWQCGHHHH